MNETSQLTAMSQIGKWKAFKTTDWEGRHSRNYPTDTYVHTRIHTEDFMHGNGTLHI